MKHPRTRPHLLIVDDDLQSSNELTELLETFDLRVSVAVTVEEARVVAITGAPDIALVDLELGPASGVELALDWHGKPDGPAVVLLSGRELSSHEERQFAGNVPLLLRKPVDINRLLEVIRNLAR